MTTTQKTVHVDKLIPSETNRALDESTVEQLARSIIQNGVIMPLAVYKSGSNYDLAAGHHRRAGVLRALEIIDAMQSDEATKLKKDEFKRIKNNISYVPVIVRSDHANSKVVSFSENLIRKAMTFSEKVAGVREIIRLDPSIQPEDIYQKLSVHKRMASEMMFISELPQKFVNRADTNPPLKGEFLRFARLPHDRRAEIKTNINAYFEKKLKFPTQPQLAKIIDRFTLGLIAAPFDITGCLPCPNNTHCQASLFQDEGDPKDGTCMKPECYASKINEARKAVAVTLKGDLEITEEVVDYTASQSIDKPLSIEQEGVVAHYVPWDKAALKDTASACDGCLKRRVVTQRQPTRFIGNIMCSDKKCYTGVLAAVQATSNTVEDTAMSDPKPGSNQKTINTKADKPVRSSPVFKPEIGDSKAVARFRRKLIVDAIKSSFESALPQQMIRVLMHQLHETTFLSMYGIADHQKINSASDSDTFAYIKKLSTAAIDSNNSKITESLFSMLVDEEFYRHSSSFQDDNFLESLTRAELLGVLDEANYIDTTGEKAWKTAVKAKKPDLIAMVMKHKFDPGFMPKALTPTKPTDFRKEA